MAVFDWMGHSCSTVKIKDVTDVDIEEDKRRLRDHCLPWDYPTVLVANDNASQERKIIITAFNKESTQFDAPVSGEARSKQLLW